MSGKYVSIPMSTGRVLAHGKITSLAAAFSLPGGIPFSIFIKKKTGTDDVLIVPCKCYLDESASDLPVVVEKWDEAAIVELSINAVNLTLYDVYWGSGAMPKTV